MGAQAPSKTSKRWIVLVAVFSISLVISLTINQKGSSDDNLFPPWFPPPKPEVNRILILASLIFMLGLLTICLYLLIKWKRDLFDMIKK